MVPKFVFDKDCRIGLEGADQPAGMLTGIGRKIEDVVRSRIMLADFISRRREKGEQNSGIGFQLFDFFDHRPALFELPQRGRMNPYQAL